jgi:hypothetical protein
MPSEQAQHCCLLDTLTSLGGSDRLEGWGLTIGAIGFCIVAVACFLAFTIILVLLFFFLLLLVIIVTFFFISS